MVARDAFYMEKRRLPFSNATTRKVGLGRCSGSKEQELVIMLALNILVITALAVVIIFLMFSIIDDQRKNPGLSRYEKVVKLLRFLGVLDQKHDRLSTKFQVMVIATVFRSIGLIDQYVWLAVAGAYIGTNFLQKKFLDGGEK